MRASLQKTEICALHFLIYVGFFPRQNGDLRATFSNSAFFLLGKIEISALYFLICVFSSQKWRFTRYIVSLCVFFLSSKNGDLCAIVSNCAFFSSQQNGELRETLSNLCVCFSQQKMEIYALHFLIVRVSSLLKSGD